QARGPGPGLHPPAMGGDLTGGALTEQVEGRGKGAWRGESGEEGSGMVAESGNGISGRLTRGTGGQMALDLYALRATQALVEIGMQLVLRNVPHGPLYSYAAGRGHQPDGVWRGREWCL